MGQRSSEVVILRPTQVFWSFLASQLPEDSCPDFRSLQSDNTAYAIKSCSNDKATLDEIEHHYSKMFRHEIGRWLGPDARNDIERSFLDFLCCFKLEFHTHLIVLESSIQQGRQLMQIKPRISLLHWLQAVVEGQEELAPIMEEVNVSHLIENSTLLIKNFNNLAEIKPFLQRDYKLIFAKAMTRISNKAYQWPAMNSLQSFNQYFSVELHTQLIHMHR